MRRYLVLFCVILSAPYAYQQSTAPKGSVVLDELSFNKITGKFKASLIKFDVAYPYGDKHDAFVALAQDARDVDDLLVAEVGVKDYGERENEALAKKYGATKENFPIVKLFVKGKSEPITFDDKVGFTSDELRRFVRENTGLYLNLPGCVKELDALALKFMSSSKNDRKNIFKAVDETLEALDAKDKASGKIYKTIMDKILDKGDEFVAMENERVKKLLGGKVSNEKKKELENRINILQTFKVFDKQPRVENEEL